MNLLAEHIYPGRTEKTERAGSDKEIRQDRDQNTKKIRQRKKDKKRTKENVRELIGKPEEPHGYKRAEHLL